MAICLRGSARRGYAPGSFQRCKQAPATYEYYVSTLVDKFIVSHTHWPGVALIPEQVVQAKVPDLHGLEDISEYVAGGLAGGASDSEFEDEESKIMLPDNYVGRGNVKSQKRCQTALKSFFNTTRIASSALDGR